VGGGGGDSGICGFVLLLWKQEIKCLRHHAKRITAMNEVWDRMGSQTRGVREQTDSAASSHHRSGL